MFQFQIAWGVTSALSYRPGFAVGSIAVHVRRRPSSGQQFWNQYAFRLDVRPRPKFCRWMTSRQAIDFPVKQLKTRCQQCGGGWMPENISGVPAGRSVFHVTSPFIGLLARFAVAAVNQE
jgi:hypothetical protein